MIVASSIESCWQKHRDKFINLYMREVTKKIGTQDLSYRYTDLNGKAYYGWERDMNLPVDRLGQLYKFSELLFKGLSPTEDERIDQAIISAIESGLHNAKEKNAAKIASLVMEREKRRKMVIHPEVILNMLALQWVREDEDPSTFNNEIQKQKVEQFMKEVEERGAYPFFQVPELIQLNSFLKLSSEELEAYWRESMVQIKTLNEALKTVYLSGAGSEKSKKTSTED